MSRYLLDTVTLSELRKKTKADAAVLRWQYAAQGQQAGVSVVTMNEIWYGCRKVAAKDPALLSGWIWFGEILAAPALYTLLPITLDIAKQAAEIRAAHGTSYNDALIAATALVHDLTLATRNEADFAGTCVTVVNPWKHEPAV